ncbi:MAG TPA: T9SS type A sorting domain-containing protein [Chitinophagales bacterium]|nr:T9SS type A sorting domain-containing protein [Chitinophagales bacterium]
MKKFFLLTVLVGFVLSAHAQSAYQFTGEDCNGNAVDLYADLDAGKAAILLYYMPDCGACPPPAQQLQEMANGILNDFPEMVVGYTFPFLDTYDCSTVTDWVDASHVPFFTPMDSGEFQVAYYGGFGMPTVVLVGGEDHRVIYSTLSYLTSDTTIIRDSIYRLFGVETNIDVVFESIQSLIITPNPASMVATLQFDVMQPGEISFELFDLTGKSASPKLQKYTTVGAQSIDLDVNLLTQGTYFLKVTNQDFSVTKQLVILK